MGKRISCGKYAPGLFALGLTIRWQPRARKSLAFDLGPFWIQVGGLKRG